MIETREGAPQPKISSRKALVALALFGVLLVVAMVMVLQLGRIVGTRHAPLKNTVQIELELVRANLGYELVLNGDPAASTRSVDQYVVRADWYAQQVSDVCWKKHDPLFLAPITPVQRKLAVLRVELWNFTDLTRARWQVLEATTGTPEADPLYDEAFRQLALRSRELKAAADDFIAIEQGVLNTLQGCLVIGALALAGLVAMTLLQYARRWQQVGTALLESEEKFRCLYRDSSDAIMLLDENSFFDCNETTLQMFQLLSYSEFCRKHPADLSPAVQPDGTESVTLANERIATALREGSHRFEWTHMRDDGTEFPAEVLLSAVHIEGRKVLQAVVRDVTERKESEDRLRSNEEQLRSISEAALDAVVMMDERGKPVHWNPAAEKMFGYTADEVQGHGIHHLLAPDRLQKIADDALLQFFQTGEGRAVGRILELQAVRKGGEEFPIEISLAPIRIKDAWCAVAVIRDITDRKLADEKIRAEQRTLRRLLKAHDQERKLIAYEIHDGLAQQLVAAIMQSQATGDDSGEKRSNDPDLLDLLHECLSETRRLISGLRPPILDEFGVVTAVEGLIEETRSRGGPDIEFTNDVGFDRLEPVLENTIYRMIQESVGNAVRHSHTPRILIALAQQGERLRIRVQDWGIGFDAQKVERSRYGLAGIRERARLLGGHVTVDSQADEGTTIAIDLPVDVGDLSE